MAVVEERLHPRSRRCLLHLQRRCLLHLQRLSYQACWCRRAQLPMLPQSAVLFPRPDPAFLVWGFQEREGEKCVGRLSSKHATSP